MDREVLKQVLADQQEYTPPKNFFIRTLTDTIKRFVDDPSIIIISGIRRSGKSTIQRSLQLAHISHTCSRKIATVEPQIGCQDSEDSVQATRPHYPDSQDKVPECANFPKKCEKCGLELAKSDYFLNFDDERLVRFKVEDFQMLLEVLIELFGEQSTFYFDEIQNIEGWERFVRRLYEQGKKIYITGSNAKLLSKELGTHLTGRYIQFEVYPLSFKEIIDHKLPDVLSKKALSTSDTGMILHHFSNYLKNGGIPDYVKYEKSEYLRDLFEGILYRDIITRYKINDEKPLRELVYYLASNIGKEFSYTKLSKIIGLSSPHTIVNYCNYLEQCYLCFFVNRYSHSLKKQIQYNKKCYMIDPALIRITGFRISEDRGRLLENIVFLHLRMLGKEVYFHKDQKECDFIIREGNQIIEAIQVTTHLLDEEVKKREINGLIEAMIAYNLSEGLILTENEQKTLKVDNFQIRVIPIWKWLLSLSQ